jgi:hypothetical protein
LLATDLKKSEIRTNERDLRASNKSFAGLLIVEAESEKALNDVLAATSFTWPTTAESSFGGLYREVFSLAK